MTTTRDDQQQQQQQQRSTARRDQLTSYQTIAQKSWQDSKVFEVHSDETKPIKFFGNFPYPYMNGLLHLGHAFSLSKLVRLFVYRYYSRVIRSLLFVRSFVFVRLSSSLARVLFFSRSRGGLRALDFSACSACARVLSRARARRRVFK
jgi:hypothetical protein